MPNTLGAYNSADPIQQQFLSALALGETGSAANAATLGTGGTDLSGASTDQYGFPQWAGQGNSHAAGIYQFQPGTWDAIASTYGLDFGHPNDQNAGAWLIAEQTYASATGGQSLETALQNGQYGNVQSALQSVWPSVQGNQAAPQGLASDLSNGVGAAIAGLSGGSSSAAATGSSGGGLIGTIENFFVRFGLIIAGGLIVLVALWYLLSSTGAIPSPGKTARLAAAAI